MIRCPKCGEDKPADEFASDRTQRSGRNGYCRACRAAWAREHRRRDPAADHRARLRRRYGITPEQYDTMLAEQGGRCAICRTDQPGGNGNRTFHVDHDHDSGAVRGLLCSECNTGLARFRDDPHLLTAAVWYLEDVRTLGPAPERAEATA